MKGETDEGKAGWSKGMAERETARFFFKTDGWEGKGGGQGYEWLWCNGWLGREMEEISRWGGRGGVVDGKDDAPLGIKWRPVADDKHVTAY